MAGRSAMRPGSTPSTWETARGISSLMAMSWSGLSASISGSALSNAAAACGGAAGFLGAGFFLVTGVELLAMRGTPLVDVLRRTAEGHEHRAPCPPALDAM
ncbi:hypothetical protein BE20_09585 [Sorangium cellulosum]|nr:hypothetical protein BE20_09585 [Sorangium cellulosum]